MGANEFPLSLVPHHQQGHQEDRGSNSSSGSEEESFGDDPSQTTTTTTEDDWDQAQDDEDTEEEGEGSSIFSLIPATDQQDSGSCPHITHILRGEGTHGLFAMGDPEPPPPPIHTEEEEPLKDQVTTFKLLCTLTGRFYIVLHFINNCVSLGLTEWSTEN